MFYMSDIIKAHYENGAAIGKDIKQLNIFGMPYSKYSDLLKLPHAVDVAITLCGGNIKLLPIVAARSNIPKS